MYDKDIVMAEGLRADAQRSPVYFFLPNPPGQEEAWLSPKTINCILGGNAAGKSQVMFSLAAAIGLEHPQDPGWSFWPGPIDTDDNFLIGSKQTREFKEKCLALRRQGVKYKLPTRVWISKNSYPDHKEVTMKYLAHGDEPKNIPPLLKGRVVESADKEPGVWDYAILDTGSRITLKAAKATVASYQGRDVTAWFLDEPHPPDIYKECKMRLRESKGRGYYGMTAAPDEYNPSMWRWITWFRDNVLVLGNTAVQEIIYIHTKENPYIDYEFQLSLLEGFSDEEKHTRLSGRIGELTGKCFFNRSVLDNLHRRAKSPLHVGTLEWTEVPEDFTNYGVYVTDDEYADFAFSIYEFPELSKNYVIGVDAGGGIDPTAVVVLNGEWEVVAVGHGHIDEVSLASVLVKLGKFYKGRHEYGAQIAIEMNSAGRGTNTLMYAGEEGVHRYTNLYRRTPSKYERRGQVRLQGHDIGWLTTGSSRPILTADLRAYSTRSAENDDVLIPHKGILSEMSTFCYREKDNQPEGWQNSHDDLVFALGIAIQVLKTNPFRDTWIESPGRRAISRVPTPLYDIRDGRISLNVDEALYRLEEGM